MNIFELVIVQPIFNLLVLIYSAIPGGDFGIAIVIFTVLVRLCLWPLIKRQLHQVKAMRKLQPKLAQIKKEAKGNKQIESMRMMELYKEHGISPFRSIVTLLIQLPIFIALYQTIRIFTTNRDLLSKYTYNIFEHIQPIHNLIANPSHFNENFLGFIDLTAQAISANGVNIFLIILGGLAAFTQYLMSRQTAPETNGRRIRDVMTEAADGKQADQSELNAIVMGKMTKVMPIFTFLIMINLPGALVLYYAVSNLIGYLQQYFILRQDEEQLEALADQPVKQGKKATAKARAKQAREAQVTTSGVNITRITAKDNSSNSKQEE